MIDSNTMIYIYATFRFFRHTTVKDAAFGFASLLMASSKSELRTKMCFPRLAALEGAI